MKDYKLNDLGAFYKGAGISRDNANSGELPAIRYGELYTDYDTFILRKTRSKISEEVAEEAFELEYGDILLAGSGETPEDIGKSAVFLLNRGYAGGDIIVFRPDKTKVDPKFLALYFETEPWKKQRRRAAQGQSIVHIHATDLKKMNVRLPDLETQKKIINILELWDCNIGFIEEIISKALLKQKWLIRRLICNNAKSSARKLSTLATIATGKKDVNQGCSSGRYPFFTCAKEHTWSNSYSFDKEAICIAGNGEIGQSFYYNGKFEAYQRTYVLTDFTISGQYLNFVIRSLFKEMVERQKQMSAMPYIKLATLKDFMVPILNEQETASIVDILNNGEDTIKLYQDMLSKRRLQKRYLLNHLINGDLDLSKIQLEEKDKSC